jgi:hypothetical protein
MSYTDASAYCQNRFGTSVVTVKDLTMEQWLLSEMNDECFWVGLTDVSSEGTNFNVTRVCGCHTRIGDQGNPRLWQR